MTTRTLPIILLAALVFSAGCTRTAPTPEGPQPLRWGADADGGIPYVFADPADPKSYIGFEVDIADALGRELGRPVKFTQRKFENLLPDLDRGDIDLIMNGFEILPERIGKCLFTKPYYVYQLQYVVLKDSPIKAVDQLKAKDVLVGTLSGSSAERYLNAEKIKSKGYEDQDGPYADLRDGVVGAVLMDLPIALYYAALDPKLKYGQYDKHKGNFRFLGEPFGEGQYAIAVKNGAVDLHKQVDAALGKLRDSGELQRILEKWKLWNDDQKRIAKS